VAPALASAAADTTKPTTTGIAPAAGATGVSTASTVSVTFSEAMDKASAQSAFTLRRTSDGAAVAGTYAWSGSTLSFRPSVALAAGTGYTARVTVAARDLAGNPLAAERLWTFTTLPEATFAPSAASVLAGTLAAGSVTSLAAVDGATYQVRSTTTATRQASWSGRVTGVSNALRSLRVTYAGKSSAACTQVLAVLNWQTGAWTTLDTRPAGTAQTIADRTVGGTLADFVSGTTGTGEVQVRVTCTSTSASFTTAGDLLRVTTTA
jgi:hypothetical protein